MEKFLIFLKGIGLIPVYLTITQVFISIFIALSICILGFFIIYFICKKLNKSLIKLNELVDKNVTEWEKKFLKKLFWKYPLWGFVQQIVILIIFYFLRKIFNDSIAIVIASSIFGLLHYPNLFLFLATFGIEQMFLTFFTYFPNAYLLGFMHGFLGTTLLYFSPSLLYTKFTVWKNYWELYK